MKFKIIFLIFSSLLFAQNNLDLEKIVYGDIKASFKGEMKLNNKEGSISFPLSVLVTQSKINNNAFSDYRISSYSVNINNNPKSTEINSIIKYDKKYNILSIIEEQNFLKPNGERKRETVSCVPDKTWKKSQILLCSNNKRRKYETKIEKEGEITNFIIIKKEETGKKDAKSLFSIEKIIYKINSSGKILNISSHSSEGSLYDIKYKSVKINQK